MYFSDDSSDSDSGCFKRGKKTTSEEKSSPRKDSRRKHQSSDKRHERDSRRAGNDNQVRRRHDHEADGKRRHEIDSQKVDNSRSKDNSRKRSKSRERHDDSGNRKQYPVKRDERKKEPVNIQKREAVDERKREAVDERKRDLNDDRRKEVQKKEPEVKKRSHSKEKHRDGHKPSHVLQKEEIDARKQKHRDDFHPRTEESTKSSFSDESNSKKFASKSRDVSFSKSDSAKLSSSRDEKDLIKNVVKRSKQRDEPVKMRENKPEVDLHRKYDEKDPKSNKPRHFEEKLITIIDENDSKKFQQRRKNEQLQNSKEYRVEKEPRRDVVQQRKGSSDRMSNKSRNHSRNQSLEKFEKHEDIGDSYGPVLPPIATTRPKERKFVGPEMPAAFKARSRVDRAIGPIMPEDYEMMSDKIDDYDNISSEDDEMIGPLPTTDDTRSEIELEREKRKIELKIQKLDQRTKEIESQMNRREDWMLELPEVRKVPDLGLAPRQFRRNEQPDFSDRSSWTKTPNDESHKKRDQTEDHRRLAEKRRHDEAIAKRDAEQEEMARKHKKQHKRDKSLLEIHEKKMKKEKKKSKDEVPERRPFSRDTDLQANRFDESRKKAVIKSASLLDDRFSRGHRKFL